VTDTALDSTKIYLNGLNVPFPPIQDTDALESCP
jgi:hypothetical protein